MTSTANFPFPPAVIPTEPAAVTPSIFTPVEGALPALPNTRARKALTPAEQEAKNKKDRERRANAKAAKDKAVGASALSVAAGIIASVKTVKKSTKPMGGSTLSKPSADRKAKLAQAKAAADKVAKSVKPVVKPAAKPATKLEKAGKALAAKPAVKPVDRKAKLAKVAAGAAKAVKPVVTKPKAQGTKPATKPGRASAAMRRFNQLVEWRGSQAELARCCGVSSVAVHKWGAKDGLIGRESAWVLAKLPGCPLTFEQMRPDVKNFAVDPKDNAVLRQLVKDCTAYIREQDKVKKVADKAAARGFK